MAYAMTPERENRRDIYFRTAQARGGYKVTPDYGWQNLENSDFSGRSDLNKVNFTDSELRGSTFENSNISGGRFISANLQNTNFRRANATNASFWGADLRGADFRGADITGASFRGVTVDATTLFDVTPPGITPPPGPPPPRERTEQEREEFRRTATENRRRARERHAEFLARAREYEYVPTAPEIEMTPERQQRLEIYETFANPNSRTNRLHREQSRGTFPDLYPDNEPQNPVIQLQMDDIPVGPVRGMDARFMFKRNLGWKDLQNSDFRGQDLQYTNFTDSILIGSNFEGTDLTESRFLSSDLRNTNFRNAILTGSNFGDADLRGADFRGAKIKNLKGWTDKIDKTTRFDSTILNAGFLNKSDLDEIIRNATIEYNKKLSDEFKEELKFLPRGDEDDEFPSYVGEEFRRLRDESQSKYGFRKGGRSKSKRKRSRKGGKRRGRNTRKGKYIRKK